MPTCFLLTLSLECYTHTERTQIQSDVSLKQQYSCTGSHITICSKLAQLTLRKAHNYADSQAHLQAGYQAYQYRGWRDGEVGVGDEVRFEVKV